MQDREGKDSSRALLFHILVKCSFPMPEELLFPQSDQLIVLNARNSSQQCELLE